ncbi:FAD/NAD(P)-binding protein [Streptomyces sp. NBC_00094]|uniref:FAD/NAD(P)-binding protein n=1 Tax=Streptomyces sp. NBC_00094 TaxID=2903620 RepID=UPI002251A49E|nr:FAD/NAD(P)-binding protein [Streptomyces sp. NBC_00094]MCX5393983.1 FAD/NAD(P)-binding protein [Streptomyces sp. NBC_00094]
MTTSVPPAAQHPLPPGDLGAFVRESAEAGALVVQPRMGMVGAEEMADGVAAVAALPLRTVATLTIDSYTRVGDHAAATAALRTGRPLNGFPLVSHGPRATARVAAAAGRGTPVQVRHGSADPMAIFRTMAAAGLAASEGGPVSYCLPYGRTPLAESVAAWRDSVQFLTEESRAHGRRAHLESFGGCLLGQLCPPSLLVAVSVLECLFFVANGATSVSLSYAQQTHPAQDAGALTALRLLADEFLPPAVDRHLVLYAYMGVYPKTVPGARLLLRRSAELAVRGGAQRLIVKTETEAHRIPTVEENLTALRIAADAARATHDAPMAARHGSGPSADAEEVLAEARTLITAVLGLSDDLGTALLKAFDRGLLDVPYCLHPDNRGAARSTVAPDGRLQWTDLGALPLLTTSRRTIPMTSRQLAGMLGRVAREHDLAAATHPRPQETGPVRRPVPRSAPEPSAEPPLRIGFVGMGPRGLSVLERLAARCAEEPPARPVEVFAIDPYEAGAGRIWRTDQSPWFLMNTPAREVTMFSGPADTGPHRPGAGPSLGEWWARDDPAAAEADGYAPRAVYGRYLTYVMRCVEETLPPALTVHRIPARVICADRARETEGSGRAVHRLRLDRGDVLTVDRLLIATGHPVNELDPQQRAWEAFARECSTPARPVRYVAGGSAVEMPLADIPAGASVGILGMGLTFYDILTELTLGRGGTFTEGGDGLLYLPSGKEPRIVAGSRGGVPLLTRGANQKGPEHRYRARLFTPDRLAALRAESAPLDFERTVLPWLLAEVNLVLLATRVRLVHGPDAAAEFTERGERELTDRPDPRILERLAAGYRIDPRPLTGLDALARPFHGRRFGSQAEFHKVLTEWLRADLAEARRGNTDGPLKAAADVLRDVRQTIRSVVDFGGLTPASHRWFLAEFGPLAAMVSTGPPPVRSEQFLALLAAGVLEPVGPGARFHADPVEGRFAVESAQVENSWVPLDVVVDARVPSTDLAADRDPLIRGLLVDGEIRTFTNAAGDVNETEGAGEFATGGLDCTDAPFHPVRADGSVDTSTHVLGIPSEHTRWFTQVGSGRPGPWGSFTRDADAIADALLGGASLGVGRLGGMSLGDGRLGGASLGGAR